MVKKTATLTRVTPPAVFLMGTRIRVDVASAAGVDDALALRLQSQLESELLSRDPRLSADPTYAEISVDVTLLNNQSSERWESRQERQRRKVGTDSEGKAIYKTYDVTVKYKVVTHSLGASYKITDLQRDASLDADTLAIPFTGEYREGSDAPELFNLENRAIASVVDTVARRVTPTREGINVLLPKGRFKDLIGLAQAGQWNRYLENVERTAASRKPNNEAYRQYALGTAYEALGYTADESEITLRYLEQAAVHYDQAIEAKPGEKFFSKAYDNFWTSKEAMAPLDRVRTALVNYRRLKDFKDKNETILASNSASGASKSLDEESSAERVDNDAVIRMAQAGLSASIILGAIDSASEVAFDVSPKGLIELSTAKVDHEIILRIQELSTQETP